MKVESETLRDYVQHRWDSDYLTRLMFSRQQGNWWKTASRKCDATVIIHVIITNKSLNAIVAKH